MFSELVTLLFLLFRDNEFVVVHAVVRAFEGWEKSATWVSNISPRMSQVLSFSNAKALRLLLRCQVTAAAFSGYLVIFWQLLVRVYFLRTCFAHTLIDSAIWGYLHSADWHGGRGA